MDDERLVLRCAISQARLTDPAKGQGCEHAAQCNYAVLCDHINLTRACPVCSGQVHREREVVRDEALRVGLAQLPAEAEAAWLRSDGGARWLRPEAVDGGCKSEGLPAADCKSEGQWAEVEIGPARKVEGPPRKRKPASLEHEVRNLAHLLAPGWKDATAGPVNARRVRKKPGAPEYIGCFCTTQRHLKTNDLPFEGLWIQCEQCTRWCHAECIGRSAEELLADTDYYCPSCRPCAPCCTCAACAPPPVCAPPPADPADADARLRAGGEHGARPSAAGHPKQSVQSYHRADGSLVQGYHRSAAKPPSAECSSPTAAKPPSADLRAPTATIPVGGAVQVARADSEHLGRRGRVVSAKCGYYQIQLPGPIHAHFRGRDLLQLDADGNVTAPPPPPPRPAASEPCAAPSTRTGDPEAPKWWWQNWEAEQGSRKRRPTQLYEAESSTAHTRQMRGVSYAEEEDEPEEPLAPSAPRAPSVSAYNISLGDTVQVLKAGEYHGAVGDVVGMHNGYYQVQMEAGELINVRGKDLARGRSGQVPAPRAQGQPQPQRRPMDSQRPAAKLVPTPARSAARKHERHSSELGVGHLVKVRRQGANYGRDGKVVAARNGYLIVQVRVS